MCGISITASFGRYVMLTPQPQFNLIGDICTLTKSGFSTQKIGFRLQDCVQVVHESRLTSVCVRYQVRGDLSGGIDFWKTVSQLENTNWEQPRGHWRLNREHIDPSVNLFRFHLIFLIDNNAVVLRGLILLSRSIYFILSPTKSLLRYTRRDNKMMLTAYNEKAQYSL